MEELELEVTIEDGTTTTEDRCFGLKGLKLQGALCRGNKLHLSSAIMSDLSLTRLRWSLMQQQKSSIGKVTLPVYLNANRSEILFTVQLTIAKPEEELSFYERGVAIIASTSLN